MGSSAAGEEEVIKHENPVLTRKQNIDQNKTEPGGPGHLPFFVCFYISIFPQNTLILDGFYI